MTENYILLNVFRWLFRWLSSVRRCTFWYLRCKRYHCPEIQIVPSIPKCLAQAWFWSESFQSLHQNLLYNSHLPGRGSSHSSVYLQDELRESCWIPVWKVSQDLPGHIHIASNGIYNECSETMNFPLFNELSTSWLCPVNLICSVLLLTALSHRIHRNTRKRVFESIP